MAVILGSVFLLGFFLDWIEITLIILPLLAPVVSALGIEIPAKIENPELVWFAVLVAVSLQTSFLTPPVGFAIFYLKGIAPPEVAASGFAHRCNLAATRCLAAYGCLWGLGRIFSMKHLLKSVFIENI
jgi:TRAP-type mannitol/chloroaromatic compound transport system permease large subunit